MRLRFPLLTTVSCLLTTVSCLLTTVSCLLTTVSFRVPKKVRAVNASCALLRAVQVVQGGSWRFVSFAAV